MPKIFICYRRINGGDAGRLQADLRRRLPGVDTYIDVRGIRGGDDFVEKLQEQLESTNVLLVVIARGWTTTFRTTVADAASGESAPADDDFVEMEIATALKRSIPIVPVLIDGVPMPTHRELPAAIALFARRQGIPLRHDRWDDDIGPLLDRLGELLGVVPAEEGDQSDASRQLSVLHARLSSIAAQGSIATVLLFLVAIFATVFVVNPTIDGAVQASTTAARYSTLIARLEKAPVVAATPSVASTPQRAVGIDKRPSRAMNRRNLEGQLAKLRALHQSAMRVRVPLLPVSPVPSPDLALVVAGILGTALPIAVIAVIVVVRAMSRRVLVNASTKAGRTSEVDSRQRASRSHLRFQSLLSEMLHSNSYPDVLGTPITGRPALLAMFALGCLCAVAIHVAVATYLAAKGMSASIVIAALPLVVTLGGLTMAWRYITGAPTRVE